MSTSSWPLRDEVRFFSGVERCAGWLSKPAGDGPHPCVVMGHGFSLTRHDRLDLYVDAFARAGIAVLAFDYRHFGDSGGEPRQQFRRRRQVEDFHNAIGFVRAEPGIDPDRIVVWGFSFGGAHALEVAMLDKRIAATIVLCPFVDGWRRVRSTPLAVSAWLIPRALRDALGRHTVVPVTAAPGELGALTLPGEAAGFAATVPTGSPWRNEVSPAIFLSVGFYRPVTRADKIRKPLWVGMTEDDITTDGAGVERLATAAGRGELHRYPGDHFAVFEPAAAARIAGDQVAFLRDVGVLTQGHPDL